MEFSHPLEGHPFFRATLPIGEVGAEGKILALVERLSTGEIPKRGSRPVTTALGAYRHLVFHAFLGLIRALRLLAHAERYLADYSSPEKPTTQDPTRGDWVDYHLAMHRVLLVTAADCAHILVAEVLQLGIEPRDCTPHVIRSNRHVRSSKVSRPLAAIEKAVAPLRESRNLFIHRGEIARCDDSLQPVLLRQLARFVHESPADILAQLPPDFATESARELDAAFDAETRHTLQHCTADRIALEFAVGELLDALLPPFERNTKKLRASN